LLTLARKADDSLPASDETRLKRFPIRGHYDRKTINAVLDSGLVCHVGFVFKGRPVVIPTLYWREGDWLFLHGSVRSRMLEAAQAAPISIAVTHLDGLVCARSGFNHSANYRSVVLFGTSISVTDPEQKRLRLKSMIESIFPDRWDLLRPITAKELAATRILAIPIDAASAKVRTGQTAERHDPDWPVWAGVVPVSTILGDPEPDENCVRRNEQPRVLRPR